MVLYEFLWTCIFKSIGTLSVPIYFTHGCKKEKNKPYLDSLGT